MKTIKYERALWRIWLDKIIWWLARGCRSLGWNSVFQPIFDSQWGFVYQQELWGVFVWADLLYSYIPLLQVFKLQELLFGRILVFCLTKCTPRRSVKCTTWGLQAVESFQVQQSGLHSYSYLLTIPRRLLSPYVCLMHTDRNHKLLLLLRSVDLHSSALDYAQ